MKVSCNYKDIKTEPKADLLIQDLTPHQVDEIRNILKMFTKNHKLFSERDHNEFSDAALIRDVMNAIQSNESEE